MARTITLHYAIAGAYFVAAIALGVTFFNSHRTPQQTAVVDLDQIARKLGSDKLIEAAVSRRAEKLNRQLVVVRQQLESQIEVAQQEASQSPADKNSQKVAAVRSEAERLMSEANRKATVNLNSYHEELLAQSRQYSKTLASKVARARGISLVVAKNDAVVLDYESAIDITDQVVQQNSIALASAIEPISSTQPAAAATQ